MEQVDPSHSPQFPGVHNAAGSGPIGSYGGQAGRSRDFQEEADATSSQNDIMHPEAWDYNMAEDEDNLIFNKYS